MGDKFNKPISRFSRVWGNYIVPSAMIDTSYPYRQKKPIIAHLICKELEVDIFPIVGWITSMTGVIVWNKNSWPELNCAPAIQEAIRRYNDFNLYPFLYRRETVKRMAELAVWHHTVRFNVHIPSMRLTVPCYAQRCLINEYECVMIGEEGTDMFKSSLIDIESLRKCIRWFFKYHLRPQFSNNFYIELELDGEPIPDIKEMEEITFWNPARKREMRKAKTAIPLIKHMKF